MFELEIITDTEEPMTFELTEVPVSHVTYWGEILGNLEDQTDLVEYIESHGGGGSPTWDNVADKPFEALGDSMKASSGYLDVKTTDDAIKDNTLPITSNGVHEIVGNIDTLLDLI